MGYGEFDLDLVLSTFGLEVAQEPLFRTAAPVDPGPWLEETLGRGRSMALFSEKSRSEFIVAPVLLHCRELVGDEYCIYSGIRLDVDPEQGLKGECDFLLARTPPTPALRSPLLVVVEAKKNDVEEGLAQCAAQMVAARKFNESHHALLPGIHGAVTTGETWQFLRLSGETLTVDADRYYITDLKKIVGVLVAILKGTV